MNEPSQSDTPQTDTVYLNLEGQDCDAECYETLIAHARTLERELTTERAARTKTEQELVHANSTLKFLDATHDQLSHDLTTLREREHELRRLREEVEAYKRVVIEHSEFGSLFQPDGRFHEDAKLILGRSAVVEGGKWLVAEYDQLRTESAEAHEEIDRLQRILGETQTDLARYQQSNESLAAQSDGLRAERDEATGELVNVCHALDCTAMEARTVSSRAESIMRSWKEAKIEVLKRDERIVSLVESWNNEHKEVCTLRAENRDFAELLRRERENVATLNELSTKGGDESCETQNAHKDKMDSVATAPIPTALSTDEAPVSSNAAPTSNPEGAATAPSVEESRTR